MISFKKHQDTFWIMGNKFLSILVGPVSLFFIVKFLDATQQGIWYSFKSLSALTVFAEMGFMMIITQFVSHEFAHLHIRNGFVRGRLLHVDRLFSLIRYAVRFYLIVIPVAICILTVVGIWFFKKQGVFVVEAWILFSITGGFNMLMALMQYVFQGLNRVADTQKLILVSTLVNVLATWSCLFFGLNVWSLAIGGSLSICTSAILLLNKGWRFWFQAFRHIPNEKIRWFNEIVKLQGKYAVSWISGYMIFQLYIPTIFKIQGPVVAGQVGLSMQLIKYLAGFCESIIEAKIPAMNMLVSLKKENDLLKLFKKLFTTVELLFFAAAGCLLCGVIISHKYDIYSERFLLIFPFLLLVLAEIPRIAVSALSVYLRSHKNEPFYPLSIFNALLVLAALFLVLPHFGINGLFISTNIIYWLLVLPVGYLIFRSNRKQFLKG